MKFTYEKYENSASGLKQFAADLIDRTYKKYCINLSLAKGEFNEENVHDLRVVIRRFIAALDLIKKFFPNPKIKIIKKDIKNQFDSLSELRDIQVMVTSVLRLQDKYPQVSPFLFKLKENEKRLVDFNKKLFSEVDVNFLNEQIILLNRVIFDKTKNMTKDFEEVRHFVHSEYTELVEAMDSLDRNSTATIHQFRIKTKKFRYLIEALQDVIFDSKTKLKLLAGQQTKMGLIQDAEVISKEFQVFLEENPDSIFSPEQIIEQLQEQKNRLIEDFFLTEHLFDNLLDDSGNPDIN